MRQLREGDEDEKEEKEEEAEEEAEEEDEELGTHRVLWRSKYDTFHTSRYVNRSTIF